MSIYFHPSLILPNSDKSWENVKEWALSAASNIQGQRDDYVVGLLLDLKHNFFGICMPDPFYPLAQKLGAESRFIGMNFDEMIAETVNQVLANQPTQSGDTIVQGLSEEDAQKLITESFAQYNFTPIIEQIVFSDEVKSFIRQTVPFPQNDVENLVTSLVEEYNFTDTIKSVIQSEDIATFIQSQISTNTEESIEDFPVDDVPQEDISEQLIDQSVLEYFASDAFSVLVSSKVSEIASVDEKQVIDEVANGLVIQLYTQISLLQVHNDIVNYGKAQIMQDANFAAIKNDVAQKALSEVFGTVRAMNAIDIQKINEAIATGKTLKITIEE